MEFRENPFGNKLKPWFIPKLDGGYWALGCIIETKGGCAIGCCCFSNEESTFGCCNGKTGCTVGCCDSMEVVKSFWRIYFGPISVLNWTLSWFNGSDEGLSSVLKLLVDFAEFEGELSDIFCDA